MFDMQFLHLFLINLKIDNFRNKYFEGWLVLASGDKQLI